MLLSRWLTNTTKELHEVGIDTARLDAHLILCEVLQKDKAWILAHPEYALNDQQIDQLHLCVHQRIQRFPLAYIRGRQEFYGREFFVNDSVLIPRPESEELIELINKLPIKQNMRVLDLGTGSGILGITLKLLHPEWDITASDVSEKALQIAQRNAESLEARIAFIKAAFFESQDLTRFSLIVANLPYVDKEWTLSPELSFEPSIALFAPNHGLESIFTLIHLSSEHLESPGYLVLEADPIQHSAIVKFAEDRLFRLIDQSSFGIVFQL